jgi:predicted dehydrogenase
MLDVAVVGTGSRGATHLDTISRLTDLYRLVGVCDARPERREAAAAQYGVPAFDHPVALLEEAKPQVVAVVIPPDAHHLVTAAAAARGCHVLSETPIATTLAMADHMIESCRRGNVVLEVSENVWRFPQERLKRLAVEAGLIGEVKQVHLWYTSGSYHGVSALRRFITAPPRRALGVSRTVPVHPGEDIDGRPYDRRTWELGVVEFPAADQFAVYQWPVGSDRGNLWEVVGSDGAIMGADLLVFEGTGRGRRRVPIETVAEAPPGGGKELVALRLAPGDGHPVVEWENPYRRYHLPGPDDVARADIYAGMHAAVEARRRGTSPAAPSMGAATEGWPAPLPSAASFYGGENGRADQELLMAIRESAYQGNVWRDLPLEKGRPTAFERQLHDEFERSYGAPPFEDPERLLGTLFPRRGLTQTVH